MTFIILGLLVVILIIICNHIFTGDFHKRVERTRVKKQFRKYNQWRVRLIAGRLNRKHLKSDEIYILNMTEEEFRRHLKKLVRKRFPICYDTEMCRYGEYLYQIKEKGYKSSIEWEEVEQTPTLTSHVKYIHK